jgi:hypothetical protein
MSSRVKRANPLKRILALLENIRHTGTGWSALCPAHDDHMNSLSLSEGRDGRALVHCFAGCDVTDILGALGLTLNDLFQRPMRAHRKGRRAQ